jgi:hypothetical protein
MLNYFFRKIRLFLIILFFVISSLSFISYLNYTNKLSSIDNHNSILNFFKPKYQHYILVNRSYVYKFHNLTQQIINLYVTTPGLAESFNKKTIFFGKFDNPQLDNPFIFNEDYYSYSVPADAEGYRLCKIHVKIIKNYFKQNEKLFCQKLKEIDTYSIIIISNKKKINVDEINNFFIKEYVNLYKKAFTKIRLINPTIKKNAELHAQAERDIYVNSVFSKLSLDNDLLKKLILQINVERIKLLSVNNEKYQIITLEDLLKDYTSFCKSESLILPICQTIVQFYNRPIYKKIINNNLEIDKFAQYLNVVVYSQNPDLKKKDIQNTYELKINFINMRYKLINNLLNSDLNNFSMEAIQFQSVEIKNNHLVLVSIVLFVFSLMISFIIFFFLSINRLYKHKIN